MQKTVLESKGQLSEAIINSYYQRFYQGRKSNLLKAKSKQNPKNQSTHMSKTHHQFHPIQISQKHNLVFNIDYQQKTNSTQKPNPSHDKSSLSQPTTTTKLNQSLKHNYQTNLTSFNPQLSKSTPPQNNLILEINLPNSPQKYIKQKFHSKHSPIKSSFERQHSNNFISPHPNVNNCKYKNAKNHIVKIHYYSKTLDLNQFNPQPNLSNETKFISTTQNDNFSLLQNSSSIQFHNDKKHSKHSKNRDARDIVKKIQFSQILTLKPTEKNCPKNSFVNNLTEQEKGIEKKQSPSKKGLFNLFKPTIQLKKRPSTGIPLKKHQVVNSPNKIDQKIEDSIRTFNYSNHKENSHNSPDKNFQNDNFSRHNRTLSLKISSPPKLSIKTREIKSIKHVDVTESQRKKDVLILKDSIDLSSKKHKNIVHLEYQQKKTLINKKPRMNTLALEEVDFLPWESVDKYDNMIEIIN